MTVRRLLLLALFGAAACRGTVLVEKCTTDDQCPANFHCATQGINTGDCLCNDNSACVQDGGAPTVCNPSGFCQVKVGCVTNADCESQEYCDTTVSECVTGTGCSSDLDCPIGTICAVLQGSCVPGCHSNGDCPRGDPCTCANGSECSCPIDGGDFVDPAGYDRSQCEIGACRTDTCAGDTSLCPYNDDCTGQPDGGLSVCEPDPRMNVLCQNCTIGPGATGDECSVPASQGADFCLIDLHGGNLFCGVDCSQGQGCPSGYECDDVVVLTQNPCASDSQCTPSKIACSGDANCPTDSQCTASGQCGGFCVADEGNGQGFCTCVTNADCPQDTCEQETGTCRISQQPCVVGPTGDATCAAYVSCVDLDGVRGCFIGRNCAPTHGLHCPIQVQQ
jgi:hypothetical protein